MLKLMKYEFIHSLRTYLTAFGLFLICCIMIPFAIEFNVAELMPFISVLMGFAFTFFVAGIAIGMFVSIFTSFQRSMFKNQGYLTLTLPVTTTELILSKMIVTAFWIFLGCCVLVFGIFLMVVIAGFISEGIFSSNVYDTIWRIICSMMEYVFYHPFDFISDAFTIITTITFVVASIYFSITLMHTNYVRNHRMLFAVIFYVAFNIIVQSTIGVVHESLIRILGGTFSTNYLFLMMMFVYFIIGVLLTMGTIYLIDHHIELE